MKLRADALAFVTDTEPDLDRFLYFFGDRICALVGCDQVIYRDISGKRIVRNAPGIEDVPQSVCSDCPFSNVRNSAFGNTGEIQMDDCMLGFEGIHTHPDCPAKSSVMRHIYVDGHLQGMLTFHYIQSKHAFTTEQLGVLRIISTYLGILLNRVLMKKSEQTELRKLQAVSRMVNAGLWHIRVSSDGKIQFAEYADAQKSVERREKTEEVLQWFWNALHSEDRESVKATLSRALREGRNPVAEYRLREEDGTYHWYRMEGEMADNGDGTVSIFGVSLDITAQKEKEELEALQKRDMDIIGILASEYTSVYYIALEEDSLIPYTMNEQTQAYFGGFMEGGARYSEVLKHYVETMVHPQDRERMMEAGSLASIRAALREKKTYVTTYLDSENRYCEMKFVKVDQDGEIPTAVSLGFADRDKETRAERERRENAERDMAVISGLSRDFSCVVYVDYASGDEAHYRFDPMFAEKIPGWTRIDNFGVRLRTLCDTLVHPEDREMFMDATREAVVRENIDRDGVYYVHFRTLVDGQISYYQAKFVRDVYTNTHMIAGFVNVDEETRREMDALSRAEAASKAKTDFLFSMSHDIRTPMNAIIGFTGMAIRDLHQPEKALPSLQKSQQACRLLLTIINDILDMSRIESGKVTLIENRANVSTCFENVESVMSELARAKNIDIVFDTSGIRDSFIYADTARIDRVFMNVLSNAVKYTPEGGSVRAIATQVEDDAQGRGVYRFIVSDTGIGMSEEFVLKCFDEFSREENSTTSGIQGTGLGLSLAKALTEMMGGRITCESAQGKGSTFTIDLPLRRQDNRVREEYSLLKEGSGLVTLEGLKVLLVEDNELNREIAVDILREEGIAVTEATDGRDAIQKVSQRPADYYDIILMDIQMPFMNGYEATQAIRAMLPQVHIPIIALSANAFEEDRRKSLEAGMDAHVAKPIDIALLKRTMASMLQKRE